MKRGICLFLLYLVLLTSLESSIIFSQENTDNHILIDRCNGPVQITINNRPGISSIRYSPSPSDTEINFENLLVYGETTEENIGTYTNLLDYEKVENENAILVHTRNNGDQIIYLNLDTTVACINAPPQGEPEPTSIDKTGQTASTISTASSFITSINSWFINPIVYFLGSIGNIVKGVVDTIAYFLGNIGNMINSAVNTIVNTVGGILGGVWNSIASLLNNLGLNLPLIPPAGTEENSCSCELNSNGGVDIHCREIPELANYYIPPSCGPCLSSSPTDIPLGQPDTDQNGQLTGGENRLQVRCNNDNNIPVRGGPVVSEADCIGHLGGTIDNTHGFCDVGPQYLTPRSGGIECVIPGDPRAKTSSAKEGIDRRESATTQSCLVRISCPDGSQITYEGPPDQERIKALIEAAVKIEKTGIKCPISATQPSNCVSDNAIPLPPYNLFLNKENCKLYRDDNCNSELTIDDAIKTIWSRYRLFQMEGDLELTVLISGARMNNNNPISINGIELPILSDDCKRITLSSVSTDTIKTNLKNGNYLRKFIACACKNKLPTTQPGILPETQGQQTSLDIPWKDLKNTRSPITRLCEPNNKVYVNENLDYVDPVCKAPFEGSKGTVFGRRIEIGWSRTNENAEKALSCLSSEAGRKWINYFKTQITSEVGVTIDNNGLVKLEKHPVISSGFGGNACTIINLANALRWTLKQCKVDPTKCPNTEE